MRLFVKYRRIERRLRGLVFSVWIRCCGGSVGARLEVDRRVLFRWRPHRGWQLGDHIYLGVGLIIDVGRRAEFVIGDQVKFMHYSVIAASESIRVGNFTQVAEHCSVRDSDHGMSLGRPMREQEVSTPVVIGSDVWIGRGVAVLRGTTIGDGTVVGANSVVKGVLPERVIVVGSPARVVRSRE